jgi:hypothetical protein
MEKKLKLLNEIQSYMLMEETLQAQYVTNALELKPMNNDESNN